MNISNALHFIERVRRTVKIERKKQAQSCERAHDNIIHVIYIFLKCCALSLFNNITYMHTDTVEIHYVLSNWSFIVSSCLSILVVFLVIAVWELFFFCSTLLFLETSPYLQWNCNCVESKQCWISFQTK